MWPIYHLSCAETPTVVARAVVRVLPTSFSIDHSSAKSSYISILSNEQAAFYRRELEGNSIGKT